MAERLGLILSEEFPPHPGGIGVYAYQVALNFTCMGIPVLVVTHNSHYAYRPTAEFDSEQPFTIRRIPRRRPIRRNIDFSIELLKIRREHEIGWVLPCTPRFASLAVFGKYLLGIPYFLPGFGTEFLSVSRWKKVILGNASQLLAISSYTGALMAKATDRSPLVITIGADQHDYDPELVSEEAIVALRVKYKISGSPLLVSVGRLNERKAHHVTIAALKTVKERFPNVQLVIVGRSMGAGEYEAKLRSFMAEADLVENVCFIDSLTIEELRILYAAADLSILSSIPGANQVEGFGIVLVEANLMGTAVIGARNGGIVDAIADGESGLLYAPGDADDLAQKVIHLLSNDHLREKMGQDGRARALRGYTWDIVAAKTWQAIQSGLVQ